MDGDLDKEKGDDGAINLADASSGDDEDMADPSNDIIDSNSRLGHVVEVDGEELRLYDDASKNSEGSDGEFHT